MSRIRSRDTQPEKSVRRILTDFGWRYRLHVSKMPGRPDIVIPREKTAVFINGCFWHQHKGCKRKATPKTNTAYWRKKLNRNVKKQNEDIKALKEKGWNVVVVWECQTKNKDALAKRLKKHLPQNTMRKNTVFKLAELFCGPGGLGLGAVRARVVNGGKTYKIKPVWANDIDKDSCGTYARNIHNGNPSAVVCGSVEEVDFEKVPGFDALAFGFPCNDFSIVGEQRGFHGQYGPLYTYGVKAINAHNPLWFMAENVGGIESANNGEAFQIILSDLEKAGKGYNLTTHLYKFEEYGVPQRRHRIVIIGIRKDLNLGFKVPAPTSPKKHITVREVLENPPIPENAPNNERTRMSKTVVERLKHIPPGENAWYEGVPEHLRLNVKKAKLSQIYKRLDPNKPSYTITGSGGGGTHGYHYSEHRALTNRERARIQTFPDEFIFEGSKESVRKQIGMAVPPKGAEAIVTAVLKTFAGVPYDWVPAKTNNNGANQANPLDF